MIQVVQYVFRLHKRLVVADLSHYIILVHFLTFSITLGKLRLAIWDTSFWPNLDTMDLKTYPKTYSGNF